MTPAQGRKWAMRGQSPHDGRSSLKPVAPSTTAAPVQPTHDAAPTTCLSKSGLAEFLGLSVRTLDRAGAMGLLPKPDLVVGRSPRWSPDTIKRWLRARPKLPGRGGGRNVR
jgi:predicted DNA-binding transcriptional regulator AlpA